MGQLRVRTAREGNSRKDLRFESRGEGRKKTPHPDPLPEGEGEPSPGGPLRNARGNSMKALDESELAFRGHVLASGSVRRAHYEGRALDLRERKHLRVEPGALDRGGQAAHGR